MEVTEITQKVLEAAEEAITRQELSPLTSVLIDLSNAYQADTRYNGKPAEFIAAKCLDDLTDGIVRHRKNWYEPSQDLLVLDFRPYTAADASDKAALFERLPEEFEKQGHTFYANREKQCLGILLEET